MTLASTQETESQMEPLEIRDRRYRAQQRIEELDAEQEAERIAALEKQIEELQAICPHPDEHRQEDEDEGIWRCRDCDLRGDLPGAGDNAGDDRPGDGTADAGSATGEAEAGPAAG